MTQKGDILHNILSNYTDYVVFLHNTKSLEAAGKILSEGFIFENQLAHTTDRVNPAAQVELSYFLYQRKDYGPYTIIIAIPKKTYALYTMYSNQFNTTLEELISKKSPVMSENDEYIYVLPPEHVAGFFNNNTMKLTGNPLFNPEYISYRDRNDF